MLLLLCRHRQVPPITLYLPALGLRFQMGYHPPTLHSRNKEKSQGKCLMQSNPQQLGSISPGQTEAGAESHFVWTKPVWTKAPGMVAEGTAESSSQGQKLLLWHSRNKSQHNNLSRVHLGVLKDFPAPSCIELITLTKASDLN